ncbi:MAG TPA: ribbon-helix-helix domain-containing protein [Balneolaceae bacterium]|nr:ribbon-helix-helix domain-containing protein [Balneolaceae bacterium]
MKRISVHLTDNQITELKDLSSTTGLKAAELIRRAIDDYLSRNKDSSSHKKLLKNLEEAVSADNDESQNTAESE